MAEPVEHGRRIFVAARASLGNGLGHFRADAIAGDERDLVIHRFQTRRISGLPKDCSKGLPQLLTDVPEEQHETEHDIDCHQERRRFRAQSTEQRDGEHQDDKSQAGEEIARRRTDLIDRFSRATFADSMSFAGVRGWIPAAKSDSST